MKRPEIEEIRQLWGSVGKAFGFLRTEWCRRVVEPAQETIDGGRYDAR
jgi:hypothetical protein